MGDAVFTEEILRCVGASACVCLGIYGALDHERRRVFGGDLVHLLFIIIIFWQLGKNHPHLATLLFFFFHI